MSTTATRSAPCSACICVTWRREENRQLGRRAGRERQGGAGGVPRRYTRGLQQVRHSAHCEVPLYGLIRYLNPAKTKSLQSEGRGSTFCFRRSPKGNMPPCGASTAYSSNEETCVWFAWWVKPRCDQFAPSPCFLRPRSQCNTARCMGSQNVTYFVSLFALCYKQSTSSARALYTDLGTRNDIAVPRTKAIVLRSPTVKLQ